MSDDGDEGSLRAANNADLIIPGGLEPKKQVGGTTDQNPKEEQIDTSLKAEELMNSEEMDLHKLLEEKKQDFLEFKAGKTLTCHIS
jgi:hypothetical protein